jgi:hypothetical protein
VCELHRSAPRLPAFLSSCPKPLRETRWTPRVTPYITTPLYITLTHLHHGSTGHRRLTWQCHTDAHKAILTQPYRVRALCVPVVALPDSALTAMNRTPTPQVLVEVPGDCEAADLDGDVGAVGRFNVVDGKSGAMQVRETSTRPGGHSAQRV